jgi:hypothetical protein
MKLSPETHCAANLDGRTLSRMIATDDPAVYQQHRFGAWQPAGEIEAPSRPGDSFTGAEPSREIRTCRLCGHVDHRNT